MWGEGLLGDARVRYVLVPIVRGDSPLMTQVVWVKGCLDETGDIEKYAASRILICG
jgi:hypothetical protein